METNVKVIKEVNYKGHKLTLVEDVFEQQSVRIDGVVKPDYASIADAKRVVNGEAPIWFEVGYMWDGIHKKVVKDPSAICWDNIDQEVSVI